MTLGDSRGSWDLRPARPEPELLDEARHALDRRLDLRASGSWRVVARRERPRSTVFTLELPFAGMTTRVYYKAPFISGELSDRSRQAQIDRLDMALDAEERLAPRLTDHFAATKVQFDEPVVLSRDRLVAIRMGVQGRVLGGTLLNALRLSPRRARGVYQRLGVALATIQRVGEAEPLDPLLLSPLRGVEADIRQAASNLPALRVDALVELAATCTSRAAASSLPVQAWAHGDVSQTNLLVGLGSSVGVIDFTWGPRLYHHDLAEFVSRISSERLAIPGWNAALTDALFTGYQLDQQDWRWRLALLQRAVRSAGKRHPNLRAWGVRHIDLMLKENL